MLNTIYGSIAIALNDYENHRTDTQYEDALIAKTFIFQYVNSFASLFYISFVKPYMQVSPNLVSLLRIWPLVCGGVGFQLPVATRVYGVLL